MFITQKDSLPLTSVSMNLEKGGECGGVSRAASDVGVTVET